MGGDVLWRAERGWDALSLDVSPTAVDRAREAAAARGLEGSVHLEQRQREATGPDGQHGHLEDSLFVLRRTA
ncbi:hypothetical protein [Brachybacterium sp. FME24]|uniref:hypothetical protein n=1 Tax=Brachybacterium sp. FME24 TaxID=2742605 RepID=UPI00186755F5|nr:hypothetical protein [Brachybacterium sp. FME24]